MRNRIALVLAGGIAPASLAPGRRVAKALVPVGGRPAIEYPVRHLAEAGFDPVFVLHEEYDSVPDAVRQVERAVCIARPPDRSDYASAIRFGLGEIAARCEAKVLHESAVLILSCDLSTADATDYGAIADAFTDAHDDVSMCLAPANVVRDNLPGRKLVALRLRGRPDSVVQAVVCLRGSLLRPVEGGFRFAHWSIDEMDRLEGLLRAARERRGTPWRIPLLVYREVLRRIDSFGSAARLVRAVILFAAARLDLASALGVVYSLSGVRLGVVDNDRWRLCLDVDSVDDRQRAEAILSERRTRRDATP